MCGRFALVTEKKILEMLFEIEFTEEIAARYNIAPSEMLPALYRCPRGKTGLLHLRWGLIPSWAGERFGSSGLINVRAETVAHKFRGAFRERRVLIPASGFYEWRKEGKNKQPYFIRRRDGQPFAFGGLYEKARAELQIPKSCAIITTAANSLIRTVHHRMPLIIPEEHYPLWLDGAAPLVTLRTMLQPYPAGALELYPVSARVNNPAFDHPDCLRKEER